VAAAHGTLKVSLHPWVFVALLHLHPLHSNLTFNLAMNVDNSLFIGPHSELSPLPCAQSNTSYHRFVYTVRTFFCIQQCSECTLRQLAPCPVGPCRSVWKALTGLFPTTGSAPQLAILHTVHLATLLAVAPDFPAKKERETSPTLHPASSTTRSQPFSG